VDNRKDYRAIVTVKNNNILKLIEESGFSSPYSFCKHHNINYSDVGRYINLKESPVKKTGEWTACIIRLSKALNVIPEVLFSEQQMSPVEKNSGFTEIEYHEIQALIGMDDYAKDPLDLLIDEEEYSLKMNKIEEVLTNRQLTVLKGYFGIDSGGKIKTSVLADKFDVCRGRINRIKDSAIKKIQREFDREDQISEFLSNV